MDYAVVRCRKCGTKNKVNLSMINSGPKCGKCGEKLFIPDSAMEINEAQFDEEVLKETIPTVVDFWAPWCGPCRMVSPILEEIAKGYPGRIKVVKINTDENPTIASQFGIQGIPTIILFRNGHEIDRLVGAVPRDHIERFLGLK